jgi:hypothetical protein
LLLLLLPVWQLPAAAAAAALGLLLLAVRRLTP